MDTPEIRIRREQCGTCIFRTDSHLDLPALLEACADGHGGYDRWRACHHHADGDTVCAGFDREHGADCTPIQIGRRLSAAGIGRVVLVD